MKRAEPTLFDEAPTSTDRAPQGQRRGSAGRNTPEADRVPLAERMRPATLDEVVGQEGLLGEGRFLRRALEADRLPSMILWGPPGCGKTTLARLIARTTAAQFVPFSAVTSGIKEIRELMQRADRLGPGGVVVFVDEIHRFNRAQQDAFLPFVEKGAIVLVGATTENPAFELNRALLSRCRVLVLEPLDDEELRLLLHRALGDQERGLGRYRARVDDQAEATLLRWAGGDARRLLSVLEDAVVLTVGEPGQEHADERVLGAADIEAAAQRRVLAHDKSGDFHYDLLSALHKSLRESHPDAAAYWLIRMLEAGEDPAVPARRMLRFAAEDVGLADPGAVQRSLAAWQGYERLGSPEGDLLLVQIAIDLALAPKSVAAYRAEKEIRQVVRQEAAEPVPVALRNAPTALARQLGHGRDYGYAPDAPEGVAGIECLPEGLRGRRFYAPSDQGEEQRLADRLIDLERRRRRARDADAADGRGDPDVG